MRKMKVAPRIGKGAPVYLAAVLEYLTAEMMELSANAAREDRVSRIKPRHLLLAVRNDTEIDTLFKHTTIAGGGVIPNIHRALIPKKKSAKGAAGGGAMTQEM